MTNTPTASSEPPRAGGRAVDRTPAEIAQAKLLDVLSCPGTQTPVEIVAIEVAAGAIRTGAIFARADGARVGSIESFQIDFVRPGDGEPRRRLQERTRAGDLPREIDGVAEWRTVAFSAEEIEYAGPRFPLSDHAMVAVEPPAAISFVASGEIEALLFAHPWSGEVEVSHGDEKIVLDLYAPHTVIPRPLKLDLGRARRRVAITPTGRRNALSGGAQCLVRRLPSSNGPQGPATPS